MTDPIIVAVAAGISFGILVGYRIGKALVGKVGGPFAGRPLVIGCAVSGSLFVLVPAVMVSLLIGRNLSGVDRGRGGPMIAAGDWGTLIGLGMGIALVIASSLIVGAFAGTLCARMILNSHPPR
jgi:hypothetical protein